MDENRIIERLHQITPLTDRRIRELYDATPCDSTYRYAWELRRVHLVLYLTKHGIRRLNPAGWEKTLRDQMLLRLDNEPGTAKYEHQQAEAPSQAAADPNRRYSANSRETNTEFPPPVPEMGMWPWLK